MKWCGSRTRAFHSPQENCTESLRTINYESAVGNFKRELVPSLVGLLARIKHSQFTLRPNIFPEENRDRNLNS